MRKNDLSVFEMEKDGFKLKLQKGTNGPILTAPIALAPALGGSASGSIAPAGALPAGGAEQASAGSPFKDIVSPMVGTFFRRPAPDAPPFVDIGKTVNEDTVVCIIE